jgi:hypothetical protein
MPGKLKKGKRGAWEGHGKGTRGAQEGHKRGTRGAREERERGTSMAHPDASITLVTVDAGGTHPSTVQDLFAYVSCVPVDR